MGHDPGRYGRFVAIAKRGTHKAMQIGKYDVLLRVPQIRYFRTRYREMLMATAHSPSEIDKKSLKFQGKSLDIIGREKQ